ncbi:hypothetical protein RhiJN_02348 [Ceratobasidium sp. AG-Ba]|nr:hypothetical protein RhiJN_02348 [Ceratobasidium sp. AG-Ba]QRW03283.1 hypothetical protein RhiLY_02282 [Ceratobasidium sp. AG-Ba]
MLFEIFPWLIALFTRPSPTEDESKRREIQSFITSVEDQVFYEDKGVLQTTSTAQAEGDNDALAQLIMKIEALDVKGRDELSFLGLKSLFKSIASSSIVSEVILRAGDASVVNALAVEPGKRKAFVLEHPMAQMLLREKKYFIVYPNIYVFETNRIICRVNERNQYEAVPITPNPPKHETLFYLENMPYWFDRYDQLWYNLSGEWYTEVTHPTLESVRAELVRCAENNQIPASSQASVTSPSSSSAVTDSAANLSLQPDPTSDEEYLYPPLGQRPGKDEVDSWFDEFKNRRAALQKTRERVPDIRCPIEDCRKAQRRPQALRDHLYFHFDIKPYKCDYGCPLAFETEANKNRHLDSCAYRRHYQ